MIWPLLPLAGHCSCLEFFEIKIVARHAQVFDDVSNDSARYVTGMPGKCNKAIEAKRVRIVPMAASRADVFATDFTQPAVKLAAVP
jgi:hypothetical protein